MGTHLHRMGITTKYQAMQNRARILVFHNAVNVTEAPAANTYA